MSALNRREKWEALEREAEETAFRGSFSEPYYAGAAVIALFARMMALAEPMFYLRDTRQVVGNCAYWWAHKSQGYTCHLELAGLYDREEADEIVNGDPWRTQAWPEHVVRAAASLQVDMQRLRRLEALK